eukprot:9491213-Pyramimonas_sp.AAC.1
MNTTTPMCTLDASSAPYSCTTVPVHLTACVHHRPAYTSRAPCRTELKKIIGIPNGTVPSFGPTTPVYIIANVCTAADVYTAAPVYTT